MSWWLLLSRRGPQVERRVRASGVEPGQTVLDYGCGPGHYTIPAAMIVGPSGHVHAVDIQPAAADMVRDRARGAGVANVTAIVADRDTGLASGSVDVVLLYDAIASIADRRGVLAELDRVLKPSGVLSVWVEHGDPDDTLPLIIENSGFVLRERVDDILNFTRPTT
jgi:ubiquinone/menaquinone biosynthesis C-methylase UbiE